MHTRMSNADRPRATVGGVAKPVLVKLTLVVNVRSPLPLCSCMHPPRNRHHHRRHRRQAAQTVARRVGWTDDRTLYAAPNVFCEMSKRPTSIVLPVRSAELGHDGMKECTMWWSLGAYRA